LPDFGQVSTRYMTKGWGEEGIEYGEGPGRLEERCELKEKGRGWEIRIISEKIVIQRIPN